MTSSDESAAFGLSSQSRSRQHAPHKRRMGCGRRVFELDMFCVMQSAQRRSAASSLPENGSTGPLSETHTEPAHDPGGALTARALPDELPPSG